MQVPARSPSARRRLLEGIARSQHWVQRQRSNRAATELGTFDFLVLCFEQISIAGAAMNCFRSVSPSPSSSSSFASSDNSSAALFPETTALLPLAILTMVFFSAVVVWVSPWLAGCCKSGCCCSRSRDGTTSPSTPLCTTRRRAMPIITVVLKLTFLNYVVGMLSRSPNFELKQQIGDLLAALLLLLCEMVDMVALLHTWYVEFRRARSDPMTIADVGARHEEHMSSRKRFILTFFDRWKDCGTVSSFLSQNELLLLGAEVPSMAWAAWTACSMGNTPDRLSYHLHRVLTMLTIVMGTFVLDQSPQLSSDVQGAVVFLVADVALSSLNVCHGRVSKQRSPASSETPSAGEDNADDSVAMRLSSSSTSDETVCAREDPTTASTLAPSPPSASTAEPSRAAPCSLLKRVARALHSIPKRQWAKAAIDCVFVVNVVLNFFETLVAPTVQSLHQLSTTGSSSAAERERLQNQVNLTVVIIDCLLGGILALSLAFRWLYAYTSFSFPSSSALWWQKISCLGSRTNVQTRRIPHDHARAIELGVQCVKLVLIGISGYVFGVVMVQRRLLVLKEGINSLIAYMIGMVTVANLADAFGRALKRGVDGSSLVSQPPTFMVEDGRMTALGKLNTAIQVLWDRLNDFLCPLSLVHVPIDYSGDVTRNFIVFYLVLAVCVLHAIIAFLDRTDVTAASYAAERFGYLVAITLAALSSTHYVPRSGSDLLAPTQLVFISFAQLLVVLTSAGLAKCWRWWRKRRQNNRGSYAQRPDLVDSLEVPILSSLSKDHADFSASDRRSLLNRKPSSEQRADETPYEC